MTAFSAPTFTHRLTDSERRAFSRAIHGGLAAKVVRQAAGTAKQAPKTATVSLTVAGRTWSATAETRDAALALLAKQID